MKHEWKTLVEGIVRLDVPFEDLYTSVFLVEGERPALIDSATTRADVEEIIIPALAARGYGKEMEGDLLVTHRHGDHSGGAKWLLSYFPNLRQVTLKDGERLGDLQAVSLAGHTEDSMGYMDLRTRSLLCGDGLQFFGVSRYGCSLVTPKGYEATLARVCEMEIEHLFLAHPFAGGAWESFGREAVLHACEVLCQSWDAIKSFLLDALSKTDDVAEIKALYAERFAGLPPLPRVTAEALRDGR